MYSILSRLEKSPVNSSETSSLVLLLGKYYLVPKSLTEEKRVMAQGRLIGCFHVIITLDQILFSFAIDFLSNILVTKENSLKQRARL